MTVLPTERVCACVVVCCFSIYRVAQKPLPNKQKIILKPVSELYLFIKLKYESSTIILFVGIRYSLHNLLSDLNQLIPMPDPQTSEYGKYGK